MKPRVISAIVGLVIAGLGCVGSAWAEGAAPTNARERFVLKRQNCPWTDEMGKYIYACVKKSDGFNAHGCHMQALDAFCSGDGKAIKALMPPNKKPADAATDTKS